MSDRRRGNGSLISICWLRSSTRRCGFSTNCRYFTRFRYIKPTQAPLFDFWPHQIHWRVLLVIHFPPWPVGQELANKDTATSYHPVSLLTYGVAMLQFDNYRRLWEVRVDAAGCATGSQKQSSDRSNITPFESLYCQIIRPYMSLVFIVPSATDADVITIGCNMKYCSRRPQDTGCRISVCNKCNK